jgi:hypothetical protein
VLTVLWIIGMSTLIVFIESKVTLAEIAKIGGVILLFVLPEKGSAFFGPVLKRRQEGKRNDA